jgi:hypothetical protein
MGISGNELDHLLPVVQEEADGAWCFVVLPARHVREVPQDACLCRVLQGASAASEDDHQDLQAAPLP